MTDGTLTIREITRDDWKLIEALFGERGACGGCWCMAWRTATKAEFDAGKGEPNKKALRSLVRRGKAHGCIAIDGGKTVAWCSVGPRATFPALARKRVAETTWDEATWSITCFFIPAGSRGKGIGSALARAAAELAFRCGARVVEGYPVLLPKSGERLPGAFAWTGTPGLFARAGFEPSKENPRVFVMNAPRQRKDRNAG